MGFCKCDYSNCNSLSLIIIAAELINDTKKHCKRQSLFIGIMKSQRKTTCGFDKGANWAWSLDVFGPVWGGY